ETTVLNVVDVPLQPPGGHAWDDASLATAERQLARFVGPMARILVRQAAVQTHDARELYGLLGAHIDDPRARERFVAHAPAADASGSHGGRRATQPPSPTATTPSQMHATASRTRAPRPLEQAFVDQTTSRLAVYLGPIAKVVARKAAQR